MSDPNEPIESSFYDPRQSRTDIFGKGIETTNTQTLADALPQEIQRCQKLLQVYKSIGPVGQFGYVMIQADINEAHKAMMEGDVVAMIRCYQKLKDAE